MTSILKVDQLQDSGGNAILTSNGAGSITTASGLNTAITNAGFVTSANAGKVLQVLTATDSTQRTTTSTSFTDAGGTLAVAITPSSASNKILILMTSGGGNNGTGTSSYSVYRDATNLGDATAGMSLYYASESANDWGFPLAMSITDSPNTTSSITYQVYMKTTNASNTARLQQYPVLGTITAYEIAG